MKDDIYIEILKYGRVKFIKADTSTFKDIIQYLNSKGYSVTEDNTALQRIYKDAFVRKKETLLGLHTLKANGYFHLLQYEKFVESKKASMKADQRAFWAMIIAIISILMSVLIPFIN